MDYKKFLELVEDELKFLYGLDLSGEEDELKAAGALLVLRDYLIKRCNDEV